MKITDIMITRFGRWNDLLLPVRKKGISLIHGPNEAGKSTLLRFIRGVLYGYPAAGLTTPGSTSNTTGWGGSLKVKHRGEHYELTRKIEENGRQAFQAQHKNKSLTTQKYEQQILQNVDADVYRTIYTLGLKELRELATLQSEHVSEFIYGTSLGAIGQQLLNSGNQTQAFADNLSNDRQQPGNLFDLSGQYDTLQQALGKADHVISQYDTSLKKQKELERKQIERKKRLEQLQREQKNYLYISRIWTPWKRQRELTAEYNRLSALSSFPSDGIHQLDKLEMKISTDKKKRKSLLSDQSKLKTRLREDKKRYKLRDHAGGVRTLIDLKAMVETAERHHAAVSADASMLKRELDQQIDLADSVWSLDRVDAVDTSAQSHLQLVTAAKNYQNAVRNRARFRKRYQKLSDTNHKRNVELQEQFRKQNITSIDEAISKANQRLRDLEKLTRLRIQEAEYDQRISSTQTEFANLQNGKELPWWASLMLTLFSLGGGFFIVAGLYRAIETGWLIGLIFLLTGIMGGGLAWAMRLHYEDTDYEMHHRLQQNITNYKAELEKIRSQIFLIQGMTHTTTDLLPTDLQKGRRDISEADLISQATQKLVDLEQMTRTEQRIKKTRKKLSSHRGKLSDHQREVSSTRQQWCDLLKKLGLRETIRTSEAFDDWQNAAELKQTLVKWNFAKQDVQRHAELLNLFREQMEQLSRKMQLENQQIGSLSQTLSQWESLLVDFERSKDSYQRLRGEYRDNKRYLDTNRDDYQRNQSDLKSLLRLGNAETNDQFRDHASQRQRISEVQALLEDLNTQLAALAQEEPELAIVEEDLIRFQPEQTQERIEMIGLEIDDLEKELEQSHQELGRLRQSRVSLESDTTLADLQTRKARLLDRAQHSLRDWQASQRATETFTEMTGRFERDYQPETLDRASQYLAKLTCGRYEQVRTPFGSQELLIHERNGEIRNVSELSDGTREQLFLAVRMALIDLFAEQGIEMPIVLDDICVNFDQIRTEAAVKTLLEFAETKQVLFFTCHQHLATLFEEQGVEATWLPNLHTEENQLLAG